MAGTNGTTQVIETAPRETDARAIIDTVKKLNEPKLMMIDGPVEHPIQLLAIPKGVAVTSVKHLLDEYRTQPERRKGTANVGTIDSFVALVNRFKDADSAIFAERDGATLTAVIDYNHAGAGDEKPETMARFGEHRVVYPCPLSDEWKKWSESHGRAMTQQVFAEFIEDRIADVIAAPDDLASVPLLRDLASVVGGAVAGPDKLYELSRGLQVNVSEVVKNATSLSTGEITVQYETVHNDGRGQLLKVPSLFLIGIPVFRQGARYQIPVRLRYRVREGKILWHYELYRADRAFDNAFDEVCVMAGTETSLPLYMGTPER